MAMQDDLELVESEEGAFVWLYFRKYPKGFVCPCGGTFTAPQSDIRFTECGVCGVRESLTANTLYHRSRKPLPELAALTIKFFEGLIVTATQAADEMEWNYNAGWRWMQKLRDSPEDKVELPNAIELEREILAAKLNRRSTESQPKLNHLDAVCALLDPSTDSSAEAEHLDEPWSRIDPAWFSWIDFLIKFLGKHFRCCVSAKHIQRYITHFALLCVFKGSREDLLIACISGKPKRSVEAYSSPKILMLPVPA